MSRTKCSLLCIFTMIFLPISCERDKDDDKKGSYGGDRSSSEANDNITITVQKASSSALTNAPLVEEDFTDCQITGNGAPLTGLCPTSLGAKAFVENIYLLFKEKSSDTSCGPARLLTINYDGDTGYPTLSGKELDFFNPKPLGGGSALYQECYQTRQWSGLSLTAKYFDYKMAVKDKVWNLRFVFSANPISNEPVIAANTCEIEKSFIDAIDYKSGTSYHRGDMLLCIKKSASDLCSDADYQWLDLTSGNFTTTRPATAYQIPYMTKFVESTGSDDYQTADAWCRTSCERNSSYCGFSLPDFAFDFYSADGSKFKLYSEIVESTDERHPNYEAARRDEATDLEPVTYYTYEAGGKSEKGINLNFTISLHLDDLVFVDIQETDELTALSDADLFQKIFIKDMLGKATPQNYGYLGTYKADVKFEFAD